MKYLKSGIAALIVVVVIGASALLMATGAAFSGLWEADSAFTADQGKRAFAIAEACLEDRLERLREDPAYSGNALPDLNSGSCIINMALPNITVEGIYSNYRKRIQASINITNSPATGN